MVGSPLFIILDVVNQFIHCLVIGISTRGPSLIEDALADVINVISIPVILGGSQVLRASRIGSTGIKS